MAGTDLNPNPPPKPLFLRARDLPFSDLKVQELCKRAEHASGVNTVEGAQLVNGLWRIFAKTDTARTTLLLEGISLRGHAIMVTDVKPYRPVDSNGRVESTTRLTISDIPMHLPAAELEDALSQVGCLKYCMRWLETNVATCLGLKQATGLWTWLCLRPLSHKHSAWEV